jgi:cytochrome c oxidase subunit 4
MSNHSAQTAPIGAGHSHGHDAHDVSKAVRKYLIVFAALLVGTIITVLVSYIDFGHPGVNIGVALFIAGIKASLVAAYFMHLIDERKLIYALIAATAFLFGGLMYFTIWSMEPTSFIHLKH